MASAAGNRRGETVFCHACSFEWERSEHGLACPSCQSDITELVSPGNDPRHADGDGPRRFEFPEDDPPEVDIEQYLDPEGVMELTTEEGEAADRINAEARQSVERFLGVVSTIGLPLRGGPVDEALLRRVQEASETGQRQIHWGSTISGGTITWQTSEGDGEIARAFEPFQQIFTDAIRGFGLQVPTEDEEEDEGQRFVGSIEELLNLFSSGVHGDGVYTQEALDRVITSLMEANPQSNAAPPATDNGLANLPRKIIEHDLKSDDGPTECTICIDELAVGQITIGLPCNHSFHEECGVLWLKQHNTCPVCRAPIEQPSESAPSGNRYRLRPRVQPQQAESQPPMESQGRQDRGQSESGSDSQQGSADSGQNMDYELATSTPLASTEPDTPSVALTPSRSPSPERDFSRPPNQSQTRLNQAMRYLSSQLEDQNRDRSRGQTTGFSYDTSRLQRRSSLSPSSPRVTLGSGERSMRERSPSQSNGHEGSRAASRRLQGRFVGGSSDQ